MDGYIKIFRQIKDWEHFQEPSVLLLFIDLLVSANFKRGYFHGTPVGKGSLITSYRKLSDETGLSVNTIKSCIKKLVASGEISLKTTKGQFTHIVINQFNKYQGVSTIDTPTDTLVDTLIDTPTDTPIDTNRRKKRNIRKEEDILESGEINSPTPPKKKTIDERIADFTEDIRKYENLYPREMLNEFWSYWTERNKSRTKFRAELQKTWDTGRRLATWAKKDDNFNKNINNNGTNQQTNRKNGLTDEEVIEAVTGGLGLHFANQNNRNANN